MKLIRRVRIRQWISKEASAWLLKEASARSTTPGTILDELIKEASCYPNEASQEASVITEPDVVASPPAQPIGFDFSSFVSLGLAPSQNPS